MGKIAIFTYSIFTVGGEQRVVSLIANKMSEKHKVTIFTMDRENSGNQGIISMNQLVLNIIIHIRMIQCHLFFVLLHILHLLLYMIGSPRELSKHIVLTNMQK